MAESHNIDALVTMFVERLPSRALAHVSGEMGISGAELSARGIDGASIKELLLREHDICDIIREDVQAVLSMNTGTVASGAVAIFIDGAFRDAYNPLIDAVTQLLRPQNHPNG